MLFEVMGWEIQKSHNEYTYDVYFNGERIAHMPDHTEGNLYDPLNMSLALKFHFWAIYYAPSEELRAKYCQWFDLNTVWMDERLQTSILDSVLVLDIEAGLVAEEER